jgi:serine/threonine-protein kinase RsbW
VARQPNRVKWVRTMTPATDGLSAARASHGTTVLRDFVGRADQVPVARHFVAGVLGSCPASDEALLIASELATNAVKHSASGRGGTFSVAVIHGASGVRLEVTDQGGNWLPGTADGLESGRGLLIVTALARSWGVTGDEAGRQVWAELDCQ